MAIKERAKWRGVVRRGGKRHAKVFETKQKARNWEVKKARELDEKTPDKTYLVDAANEYLDFCERQFSRKTYDKKKRFLHAAVAALGDVPINAIEPRALLQFIHSVKTTKGQAEPTTSNALCNDYRKTLHAFFGFCGDFFGLQVNPVKRVKRLPHKRKLQAVPSEEEVVKLLLAADRHDRNLLVVFAATGGRKSEVLRLTWTDDINFERRTIRFWNRKSRDGQIRERLVEMNDMVFDALQDQYKTRLKASDYVFQNRAVWVDKAGNVVRKHPNYGERYTARRRLMKGLCKRADIKDFGFHGLRRFFASLLADTHRESIPTIQKLLGHASPRTTELYVKRISGDTRAAVEKIQFDLKSTRKSTRKTKKG
jgi:integrase